MRNDPVRYIFSTPYDQFNHHEGKICSIVGKVETETYDGEDVGVLLLVKFDTGEEFEAWPEELIECESCEK